MMGQLLTIAAYLTVIYKTVHQGPDWESALLLESGWKEKRKSNFLQSCSQYFYSGLLPKSILDLIRFVMLILQIFEIIRKLSHLKRNQSNIYFLIRLYSICIARRISHELVLEAAPNKNIGWRRDNFRRRWISSYCEIYLPNSKLNFKRRGNGLLKAMKEFYKIEVQLFVPKS